MTTIELQAFNLRMDLKDLGFKHDGMTDPDHWEKNVEEVIAQHLTAAILDARELEHGR